MEILYFLGNGFDLNLGLKTSYTAFYNYYNSLTTTKEKVKFLKESISQDYQTWSDLEVGLGEFTTQIATTEEFIDVFEDISDQLATYLENEENSFNFSLIDKNKFYDDLCNPEKYLAVADTNIISNYRRKWKGSHWNVRIVTLNYTRSVEKILETTTPDFKIGTHSGSYQINLKRIEHLHGYIDERMIMGVNDISQIKNESFHGVPEIIEAIVKPNCNQASKANIDKFCASQIDSADLICIFGCSLGITDNTWWELIGNRLKQGIKLVIFTRGNEISKRRPYKILPHERQVKKHFFDKTKLTDSEKESLSANIFVAHNSDMFSHMRTHS